MILFLKPYIHRLDGGNFNCYNLYKWGGVLKKTRLLKIVLKRTGAIKLLCSYVIVFFCGECCNMDFRAEHNTAV